jgi:predicted amidohydrolase YtcJ
VQSGTDILFRGGAVFDGSGFLPEGSRVLVRNGMIAEAGPGVAAGRAEVVDLDGGTLLPGFIDAHAHPVFAGNQLRHCDLRQAQTAAGYLELIAQYAQAHPGEAWITGGGWSMDAFPGGIPTREALDAVVPDRPIYLPNKDGHGAWVNSRALALAGIDAATPDPADGRIERDADGRPAGMLQEGATRLVSRLLPEVTEEEWYQALLAAQAHLLSFGITGWQDAIVGSSYLGEADPLAAYLRAASAGTLAVTVVGALWWDRDRGLDQLPELIERRRIGQAGRFRATSVKMMLDGVAENHTAAMLEPYLDADGCGSGNAGLDFIDPAQLPRFVTALAAEGFQVHFHTLGDRAVRNALDAVEAARAASGSRARRHHLAHLQVVHPADIPRFGQLGATANIQPLWAAHEPQMDELTIPFLGERRAGWQYPFKSLLAAGAPLCGGSDWPVTSPDPLLGMHVAVNRSLPASAGGQGADPFLPGQALSLADVLAAYTSGSAAVNGLADRAGAVRPGFDADFAVVDADLAHLPPAEICQAAVTQTWIRGEVVYQQLQARLPAAGGGRARRADGPSTRPVARSGRRHGIRTHRCRLRPLGQHGIGHRRQRVPHSGADHHHARRDDDRAVRHLGGLPGRELARPDLRVRLPGEHRHLADVRVAAAPGPGRRAAARPGDPHHPVPHPAGVHHRSGREVLGRPPGDPGRRRVQPGPQHQPEAGRVLRGVVQPGRVHPGHRGQPGDDHAPAA